MGSRHRQIIPADSTTRVVIETSALAQSIKAAALFARDSANAVYLNVRYATWLMCWR